MSTNSPTPPVTTPDSAPAALQQRASSLLHQAFCHLRYLAKRPLNEQGRDHMYLVADAAHNIPEALANPFRMAEPLEQQVSDLERLLAKGAGDGDGEAMYLQAKQISRTNPAAAARLFAFSAATGYYPAVKRNKQQPQQRAVTLD